MGGDAEEFAAGRGNVAGGQRKPGDESDVFALAVVENGLGGTIEDAVTILDGDDRNDLAGVFDFLHGNFGQADVFYFSLLLQILQSAELILRWEFGIDAMELEEINALEAQAFQAALAGFAQMLGVAVHDPLIGAGAVEAGFGGED